MRTPADNAAVLYVDRERIFLRTKHYSSLRQLKYVKIYSGPACLRASCMRTLCIIHVSVFLSIQCTFLGFSTATVRLSVLFVHQAVSMIAGSHAIICAN